MAEILLTPPQSWVDQLRTLPLDELSLSYDPRTLKLPAGRSLRDVKYDLEAGAWLARVRSARDEIFRLGSTEFELRVKRRPGKETGVWMAEVRNIDESNSVPRRSKILPRRVTFEKVWEEVSCDLDEIETELQQRERRLREDSRRGAPVQAGVRAHGELQAAVRREYGELESLVSVLEQRPQRPEETILGIVQPEQGRRRGPQAMVVAPRSGEIEVFRGKRVQVVRPDGRSYNTRVLGVRRGLLEIVEPQDWTVKPGEQVSVSIVRPFGMRQNIEALAKFRAGHVEGSWDDLARLLCRPGKLVFPPQLVPPPVFYCDDDPDVPVFNSEQRQAVAGAVSSPHAFLIQGPPGTGKTEVICEIIRQLVGRGERVPLLAPTHVAVDEVLRRAGRKPGVRPLRITWSEDQVDQELRAFLPKNVGIELASKIGRPADDGQLARWERERPIVDQRLATIAELRDVVRRRAVVAHALRSAQATATDASEQLRVRTVDAEDEVAAMQRALAKDEQTLAVAHTSARNAAQLEEAERVEIEPGLMALREAANELTITIPAAANATTAARAATEALHRWSATYQAELDQVTQARASAERATIGARQQFSFATQMVNSAQQALADVVVQQSVWGRFAELLRLGVVARQRRALASAQDVARWLHTELAQRDASWQATTAAYDDLIRRTVATTEELRRRVAKTQSASQDATWNQSAAFQGLLDVLSALGRKHRFDVNMVEITPWEERRRVALAMCRAIDTVVGTQTAATDSSAATPSGQIPGLGPVIDQIDRLRRAGFERACRETELVTAVQRRNDRVAQLRHAETSAHAEIDRFRAEFEGAQTAVINSKAELDAISTERDRLLAKLGDEEPAAADARLVRRRHVLQHLPSLGARWRELASECTDDQYVEDIRNSLVRATNVVCATTKGIVGKGSELVRYIDYDTLIVDEASRVTESEFLIGAVKARRWVLVGDEHQLPPYVDQEDEHFLHALIALYRAGRGMAPTIERAVNDLAEHWVEDEKERVYRQDSVLEIAHDLNESEQWSSTFRSQFQETHKKFSQGKGNDGADTDQRLLQAMLRYLVQSLFQRAVGSFRPGLGRQRLIWQRRMIRPLARIVNGPIYHDQYQSPSDVELAAAGVTPLVLPKTFERPAIFLDTSHYLDAGEQQIKHGFVNKREQDWVIRACEIYNAELHTPVTVSVLAFYRAQARELERRLLGLTLPMLRWDVIDVIDRIQGQQSDLVVLSFTRARPGGFGDNYGQWLQDVRRLNVACTRARRALVLVGHGKTLRRLRASEQAQAFYANLLGLFDTDKENFQQIFELE